MMTADEVIELFLDGLVTLEESVDEPKMWHVGVKAQLIVLKMVLGSDMPSDLEERMNKVM